MSDLQETIDRLTTRRLGMENLINAIVLKRREFNEQEWELIMLALVGEIKTLSSMTEKLISVRNNRAVQE